MSNKAEQKKIQQPLAKPNPDQPLIDALNRTHTERFLFLTSLIKAELLMKKAKTHTNPNGHIRSGNNKIFGGQ